MRTFSVPLLEVPYIANLMYQMKPFLSDVTAEQRNTNLHGFAPHAVFTSLGLDKKLNLAADPVHDFLTTFFTSTAVLKNSSK